MNIIKRSDQRIILFTLQIIPSDEDNRVENCMANCCGHVTHSDQSELIKINNDHVTHLGKETDQ